MQHLYYRPTLTMDPEERLEDATLHKALFDEFGEGLVILRSDEPAPHDGLFLGRGQEREWDQRNVLGRFNHPYWKDPAFTGAISRSFLLTDLPGAEKEVKRLHGEGKDAFIKSTQQKHFVKRIPTGQSFHEAMDGMAYSFIDKPDCLMVQEGVNMLYERRFLVMNGAVIAQSPVAAHLTPMSRAWVQAETGFDIEDMHYRTPGAREARFSPAARERMTAAAQAVADASETPHLCIDLAILGEDPETDPIEVIEFNPMQPGNVGLYGCDPRAIARGVRDALSPELAADVEEWRRQILARRAEEEAAQYRSEEDQEAWFEARMSMLGDKLGISFEDDGPEDEEFEDVSP